MHIQEVFSRGAGNMNKCIKLTKNAPAAILATTADQQSSYALLNRKKLAIHL